MPCLQTRVQFARRRIVRTFAVSMPVLGLISSSLINSLLLSPLTTAARASSAGDVCRKEICDNAVAECLRADLQLNPFARTEPEKKEYCAQFFQGCMTRSISPDVTWYSPTTVARFMQCPS
jgi:hypothetical protein